MNRLTAKDLLALEYGATVFLRNGSYVTTFRYVGRMPSNERYLIFCSGENLKHLYISEKDDTFKGEWYSGEFDERFIIELRISELETELSKLRAEIGI